MSDHGAGSYEDLAAALLAQIADLLLGDKKDWTALERLQEALIPPKPPKKTSADLIKSVYDPRIVEAVKKAEDAVTKRYVEDHTVRASYPVSYTNTAPTNTANGAIWVHTDFRPKGSA